MKLHIIDSDMKNKPRADIWFCWAERGGEDLVHERVGPMATDRLVSYMAVDELVSYMATDQLKWRRTSMLGIWRRMNLWVRDGLACELYGDGSSRELHGDGSACDILWRIYIYIYIWRRASACETRKICSILFFRIWVCRDSISASFWKGKYSFVFSETISCHVIENVFWSFPDVFNNGLYRGVLVRNNIMFF